MTLLPARFPSHPRSLARSPSPHRRRSSALHAAPCTSLVPSAPVARRLPTTVGVSTASRRCHHRARLHPRSCCMLLQPKQAAPTLDSRAPAHSARPPPQKTPGDPSARLSGYMVCPSHALPCPPRQAALLPKPQTALPLPFPVAPHLPSALCRRRAHLAHRAIAAAASLPPPTHAIPPPTAHSPLRCHPPKGCAPHPITKSYRPVVHRDPVPRTSLQAADRRRQRTPPRANHS